MGETSDLILETGRNIIKFLVKHKQRVINFKIMFLMDTTYGGNERALQTQRNVFTILVKHKL